MRALILLSLVIATPAFAADRVDLFDSKTLQGWRQQNGTVTYRDVDGAVVGKTSEASPNSILCTTRDYGDFEMESDVKVHDRLNTAIMICAREREKTVGEGRNNHRGRVNGPKSKSKPAARRAPKPAMPIAWPPAAATKGRRTLTPCLRHLSSSASSSLRARPKPYVWHPATVR